VRVVFDTNVLVSALLVESSLPAQLMTHWRKGRFALLTAPPQFEELTRVTRYPKIRARLAGAKLERADGVGRLVRVVCLPAAGGLWPRLDRDSGSEYRIGAGENAGHRRDQTHGARGAACRGAPGRASTSESGVASS
jgi:hypothetical protein